MAQDDKKMFWGVIGTAFLLSIIAGALAGVISSVFTDQSLQNYFESLSQDERLAAISEVKPRPLPGTYEEALGRVQETAWPALAALRVASTDADTAQEMIHIDDVLGYGAIVTSDGWIAFHTSVLGALEDVDGEPEVWVDGERYEVVDLVSGSTDFVMVRVEAQDLPALAFGASDQMQAGSIIFAVTGSSSIVPTSLRDAEYPRAEIVNPAEVFETQWELDDAILVSGPLFNSAGEFVGLGGGVTNATPLHHGLPFVHAVLRGDEASAAAIGAYVVDIDSVLNIDNALRGNVTAGALVMAPDARTEAVVSGGPADEAGLQEGDVILSVNGTQVAANISLSELIAGFRPGDQTVFTILRNGETQDLYITFANFSDLIY